ncbi:ATP-binding protein [Salinibacterium sp. ZJ450]|uniref:ATP-binding protein n=1 Tax=Salinibacterium sp. ZJ450 TaxID=2708338 RepID=UPI001423C5C8|nr:ATP-binding protein [Salinibacterium sp. ZJ450]
MTRPRHAMIGGVCAGLAAHLGVPVPVVRLLMVLAAFLGGAGVLFYLWLWALTPLELAPDAAGEVRRRFPTAPILVALAGVTAIISLLLAEASGADAAFLVLATILLAGGAVAWSLLFDRRDPERSERYGVIVRTVAAALMLVTAVLLLSTEPMVLTTVLSVAMIIAGVGVLVAPYVVRLWTELIAERSARVREESRAEVAAHLHDSVLQTLALIQNRAGASTEIARIARAQERELRDWLFAGTRPSDGDFASELREIASEIELQLPVRFDIVTTGDFTDRTFPPVLAAAREAMLNAARHAGGDVSVYVELSTSALDVFIRDRGPGFALDAVPDGRLGVKGSIIGRMSRHGGTATVTSSDTGTEIHLHLETGDGK